MNHRSFLIPLIKVTIILQIFLKIFTQTAFAVEIYPYFITPKPVVSPRPARECLEHFAQELKKLSEHFSRSKKAGIQIIVAPEDAIHLICPEVEFWGDSITELEHHEAKKVLFYDYMSLLSKVSQEFPDTLFVPGSLVLIDQIPESLKIAAQISGFQLDQDGTKFRPNRDGSLTTQLATKGGAKEEIIARGVARAVTPVIFRGQLLRLISKGSPLQKTARKYKVLDYGEDDLDPSLIFWGREPGLPRTHYTSVTDEIFHSPYFSLAPNGTEVHFGLQICRDHREFNLLNPPETQNYGELPTTELDVQIIVASGTLPHDPKGHVALREDGLLIHSDFVDASHHADRTRSVAYPFSTSRRLKDLPDLEKGSDFDSSPLFNIEWSSYELNPIISQLEPLVTTEQMRAYSIYQHIRENRLDKIPLGSDISVLELGAGLANEKDGFHYSPETFEIQSLFQNHHLRLEIIDRSADVLAAVTVGNYKIPSQLRKFRNFEGIPVSAGEFASVLSFWGEMIPSLKINRTFTHHTVSTHQSDFKDLTSADFEGKSYDSIFALNSLWYFLRYYDRPFRASFLELLLSHLKPGGELYIDSDTEVLIRDLLPAGRTIVQISGLLFRIF